MVLVPQQIMDFVFDTLAADATFSATVGGRIYRDRISATAALPAAIVGPIVAAPPGNTVAGDRVVTNVQFDVHIVGDGASYGPINPAADRADVLLQGRTGTNNGVHIGKLVQFDARYYPEDEAGKSYVHIVQTYSTPAYPLP